MVERTDHDLLTRIDEALNGENGLVARFNNLELVVVGGIDPATRKPIFGMSQKLNTHLSSHATATKRLIAIATIIATIVATGWDDLLRALGVIK